PCRSRRPPAPRAAPTAARSPRSPAPSPRGRRCPAPGTRTPPRGTCADDPQQRGVADHPHGEDEAGQHRVDVLEGVLDGGGVQAPRRQTGPSRGRAVGGRRVRRRPPLVCALQLVGGPPLALLQRGRRHRRLDGRLLRQMRLGVGVLGGAEARGLRRGVA
uniref:Uncharacterized protein n=1 Tax=Gasterosteus aculeatus TaxID=69293 RepID=G3Q419_GASAC